MILTNAKRNNWNFQLCFEKRLWIFNHFSPLCPTPPTSHLSLPAALHYSDSPSPTPVKFRSPCWILSLLSPPGHGYSIRFCLKAPAVLSPLVFGEPIGTHGVSCHSDALVSIWCHSHASFPWSQNQLWSLNSPSRPQPGCSSWFLYLLMLWLSKIMMLKTQTLLGCGLIISPKFCFKKRSYLLNGSFVSPFFSAPAILKLQPQMKDCHVSLTVVLVS